MSGEKHAGMNLLKLVILPALTIVLSFCFLVYRCCIKQMFEEEEEYDDEEPVVSNKKSARAKID